MLLALSLCDSGVQRFLKGNALGAQYTESANNPELQLATLRCDEQADRVADSQAVWSPVYVLPLLRGALEWVEARTRRGCGYVRMLHDGQDIGDTQGRGERTYRNHEPPHNEPVIQQHKSKLEH